MPTFETVTTRSAAEPTGIQQPATPALALDGAPFLPTTKAQRPAKSEPLLTRILGAMTHPRPVAAVMLGFLGFALLTGCDPGPEPRPADVRAPPAKVAEGLLARASVPRPKPAAKAAPAKKAK